MELYHPVKREDKGILMFQPIHEKYENFFFLVKKECVFMHVRIRSIAY